MKGKKKKESADSFECLSEAAAHLPPTVSQLLLQALFIADLRSELYTHLALQLCLFRVLRDACLFCVLQYTSLPTYCNCSPFLFRVCMGSALPPLSSGACHTLAAVGSLPLSKHTGGGGATPRLLWPACLFTVCMEKCPPPSPVKLSTQQPLLHAFPLQGCWVGAATPAFSGQLVYLQCT
jgi:hypothetical protein